MTDKEFQNAASRQIHGPHPFSREALQSPMPAFPVAMPTPEGGTFHAPGMTLRDWFAGQALAGLMMKDPWGDPMMLASYALNAAEAMLATRANALLAARAKGGAE